MSLLLIALGKVRSVFIFMSSAKGKSICSEDLIIDLYGSSLFMPVVDFWSVTLQQRANFSGSAFFLSLLLYSSSIYSVRLLILSSILLISD